MTIGVGKVKLVKEFEYSSKIQYTHASAMTAWTPVLVANLGPMIPVNTSDASVLNEFYTDGIFECKLGTSITCTAGDLCYYDTTNAWFTNTYTSDCFVCGRFIDTQTTAAGLAKFKLKGVQIQYMAKGVKPAQIVFTGTAHTAATVLVTNATLDTISVPGVLATDVADVRVSVQGTDASQNIVCALAATDAILIKLSTLGLCTVTYTVARSI